MDFALPEELLALRKTVRRFVDEVVEPVAQQIEKEDKIPESVISKAKELGLFGLSIPEEYGGLGLSMVGRCVVYEELGRTHSGVRSLLGAHNGIGTYGIVSEGTEEQKKRYLPRMARGELIGAFALTEPEAGSDAANIKTTAEKKGDRWILNGVKHFITNGPIADVVTVLAVTDRTKGAKGGISAFIVEKSFPGFSVGTIDEKMGLRGSKTSELVFRDCEVPEENLLGKIGEGYITALKILTNGRACLAAACVGACEKLIDLSVSWAKQRVQFGKPIAEFQAIQFMLADMATETRAAKLMTYETAWMVDKGMNVIKEAAQAKMFASEVLGRVVDKAVQIHGGMGYMKEFPIERYYRDARITRIYEGTNEIQRIVIASRMLR